MRRLYSKEALREAFKAVDAAFVSAFEVAQGTAGNQEEDDTAAGGSGSGAGGPGGTRYPGCTASVALVWGNMLYVANAGDCRTVGSCSTPLLVFT